MARKRKIETKTRKGFIFINQLFFVQKNPKIGNWYRLKYRHFLPLNFFAFLAFCRQKGNLSVVLSTNSAFTSTTDALKPRAWLLRCFLGHKCHWANCIYMHTTPSPLCHIFYRIQSLSKQGMVSQNLYFNFWPRNAKFRQIVEKMFENAFLGPFSEKNDLFE